LSAQAPHGLPRMPPVRVGISPLPLRLPIAVPPVPLALVGVVAGAAVGGVRSVALARTARARVTTHQHAPRRSPAAAPPRRRALPYRPTPSAVPGSPTRPSHSTSAPGEPPTGIPGGPPCRPARERRRRLG